GPVARIGENPCVRCNPLRVAPAAGVWRLSGGPTYLTSTEADRRIAALQAKLRLMDDPPHVQ
ncbi:MAG: hypothetical protein WCD87_05955, partial [Pseudolabrys sp.]